MRVHLAEIQLPNTSEDIRVMIDQVHDALSACIGGHIDASGHKILPLRGEDIIYGKKYMDVIGESGATYYLRRKFKPEKVPNWGVNNSGIMEAFYHKKSIKEQGTILGVKCGDEWIAKAAA
jgi:hypothetical protein